MVRLVGSLSAWQKFRDLEEQVIADQLYESLLLDHESRIVEGVDLALKFSLTPEQVHRICGAIVGQRERVKECTKFVQNWLMHSSVTELTAYLEKK